MRVAFFDCHGFEQPLYSQLAGSYPHLEIHYFPTRLSLASANMAAGCDAITAFVNDDLSAPILEKLAAQGVKMIALRSAGYNHLDVAAMTKLGLRAVRVPEYSPHAVAEHAIALLLCLNRKIHRAYNRVRENNFSLDGLVGFDLFGKNFGLIGGGKIGQVMARIIHGFGGHILVHDPVPSPEIISLGGKYVGLQELLANSQIISLHCPLIPATHHIINDAAFAQMPKGSIIINTGRGALIDSKALIRALKSNHLGGAALDVYEEEAGIFFEDYSATGLDDDVLARLLTFPNVIMTAHQGFLTAEALHNIASTSLANLDAWRRQDTLLHEIR